MMTVSVRHLSLITAIFISFSLPPNMGRVSCNGLRRFLQAVATDF